MKITHADRFIAWLTLLSGLCISAVAVWYSVAGLVSIFAASALAIMIMGVVLEVSKLVATVWLKQNWFIAPTLIKGYLLAAVAILMIITSMGIFGYLSKAHLDQAVPTGTVVAKVAIIDEKIKTERDNAETARVALRQLDTAVNEIMSRSKDERGAERSAQLRRQQSQERTRLNNDVTKANTAIAKLNEERAPAAAELRAVEAEVGPIKYIAALLYGDNPDANLLERAVRWVIIIIVIVFDPLAIVMLLASQYSFQYFRSQEQEQEPGNNKEPDNDPTSPGTDDAPVDRLDVQSDEPAGVDPSPPAPKQEIKTADYRQAGRIEPSAVFWTAMPGTIGGAKVVFPDVKEELVETTSTPQVEFEVKAQERRTELLEIAERARSRSIAPPGTPGEAWLTPPETAIEPVDELDKVYKQATATEAKRRRSRGWLQSSFPTKDE